MADTPDDALFEAVANAIHEVQCNCGGEAGFAGTEAARAAYAAMVEHLGLRWAASPYRDELGYRKNDDFWEKDSQP